jgi:hypothetical protein
VLLSASYQLKSSMEERKKMYRKSHAHDTISRICG